MSPAWEGLLSSEEQQVFQAFTWNKPLGQRPALLVIDVNYAFVGLKPEKIVDSVKDYSTSCGERGWAGVANIKTLLADARANGIPVIYTTIVNGGRHGAKWARRARDEASRKILTPEELEHQRIGNTIVAEIAPSPGEIVIEKRGASGFLGTPLMSYLNELDVDTLLITGTTTSGCVRATAVDAACENFYVGVVEECCFDRFDISHRVSLMDIHAKYGQVMSLRAAQEYVKTAQPAFPESALAIT
ncbi:MAG TPA: isochorismatase family protein [Chloroflexota bacterium]|jgi:nicotinamidase-related amidase|nr:isochorismatase family protein [Chloroflexota bacterium]